VIKIHELVESHKVERHSESRIKWRDKFHEESELDSSFRSG